MGLLDTSSQHDSRVGESVSEAVKEAQHEMDRMEGKEDKARMDEFGERLDRLEERMSEPGDTSGDPVTREEFEELRQDVDDIARMLLQLARERPSR